MRVCYRNNARLRSPPNVVPWSLFGGRTATYILLLLYLVFTYHQPTAPPLLVLLSCTTMSTKTSVASTNTPFPVILPQSKHLV